MVTLTGSSPVKPPRQPDALDALYAISMGKTSAGMTAYANVPANYDHYRTLSALRDRTGPYLAHLFTVAGDDVADRAAAYDHLLAAEIKVLEDKGWTPEGARAAFRAAFTRGPGGYPGLNAQALPEAAAA